RLRPRDRAPAALQAPARRAPRAPRARLAQGAAAAGADLAGAALAAPARAALMALLRRRAAAGPLHVRAPEALLEVAREGVVALDGARQPGDALEVAVVIPSF